MRHSGSPASLPAATSCSARPSSLEKMPPCSLPNEMIIAPVSVARSTIISGDQVFCAQCMASHRTRRSEEHTSELQSLMRSSYAVFCLQKKNHEQNTKHIRLQDS